MRVKSFASTIAAPYPFNKAFPIIVVNSVVSCFFFKMWSVTVNKCICEISLLFIFQLSLVSAAELEFLPGCLSVKARPVKASSSP